MRVGRRREGDFAREIDAHLDLETDRLVADGMSPEEAAHAARRAFGNVLAARERYHDAHTWLWAEQLLQDVRYAWRGLRRSPVFLITAVLTLAVGIGLVTATFAVFNAYVLRPFAVRDPYALRQIVWRAGARRAVGPVTLEAAGSRFQWIDYQELRRRTDLFDAVIAQASWVVTSKGRPLVAQFVSGDYFEALGPRVRLGRMLEPFDAAVPGASAVAVLSDDGWARMFGRAPDVIGRTIEVNDVRLTVVGVLRPEFSGLDDTPRDLFVPITMSIQVAKTNLLGSTASPRVGIVTRLRRGVSPTEVDAALTPLMPRLTKRQDDVRAEARWLATPNPLTVDLVATLSPVFAAFLLVLAAAAANVSNMMLARGSVRRREIAMRLSLGASRGRVVRQLVTEGLLIAALAAVAGVLVAVTALRVGTAVFFAGLPSSVAAMVRVAPLDLDHRVFACALAAAGSALLLFALMPARQATSLALTAALRDETGATSRRSRLRSALVISQVTVSLVLVVAAATVVHNGVSLDATRLGFETRGVISLKPRTAPVDRVWQAGEMLRADPRVSEVAASSRNPLSEQLPKMPIVTAPGASVVATSYQFVSPEYFSILRIPILRGRGFSEAEARTEAPVAVVSAAAAQTLWPDHDPIGRTLRVRVDPIDTARDGTTLAERGTGDARDIESFDVQVVGVAGDVVSGLMVDGLDPSHLYLPTAITGPRVAHLLVRGRSGDLPLEHLRAVLRDIHPDPLAFELLPIDELREAQMFPVKAAAWIGSVLGIVALALSASGLYGMLAYVISQRTREIGIRLALGATGAAVVRLVMTQSARLAGMGAAIGSVIALAVLRILGSLVPLRNVLWLDLGAFLAGLGLVAAATVLASLVPARRACAVDPAVTLRAEG